MIIVDTNVVSELMRPAPSASVAEWFRSQPAVIFTTAVTEAEVLVGIALLPEGRRKQQLPFDTAAA